MSRQYISEKAQERVFNIILKRQENLTCADCCTKGPRWVSIDFGVFICMDCAGAHRALGPQVTRVRSTNIDGWHQENVEIMEAIGNAAANSYWENQLPRNYVKPTINMGLDALIKFVQEKYQKKKFIPPFPCDDPKTQFLKTQKSIKPNYFQEEEKSPVEVPTPSAKLGDLLDMDFQDDEFQPFSSVSQQGTYTAHSLSPPQREVAAPKQEFHAPAQSLPSLDIMNLYKSNHQQQQQQSSNNFGVQQHMGYAYLSNMNKTNNIQQQQVRQNNNNVNAYQISQQQQFYQQQQQQQQQQQFQQQQFQQQQFQQQQQQQYQFQQQQFQQHQYQFQQQNINQPLNIMDLYGQK